MRAWTGLVVTLISGCAHGVHGFREPLLWDDEAVVVTAHRADIAEAEGALIRQLRERGEFRPDLGCEFSARACDVSTSETENAYQVFLVYRPELCRQASGDASLPPMARGADAGPMEFAVSRKDLRVIRARLRGDPVKPIGAPRPSTPSVTVPPHSAPMGAPEFPQAMPISPPPAVPEPLQKKAVQPAARRARTAARRSSQPSARHARPSAGGGGPSAVRRAFVVLGGREPGASDEVSEGPTARAVR
jgi:hypothetical protein